MIKKLIILSISIFTLSSCNLLDFDESSGMTKEEGYAYFSNVTKLASAVYAGLPVDYGVIGGAMRESATDNSVYTLNSSSVYDMYSDAWSPINTIDPQWEGLYKSIRRANSFLENYSEENLERHKWDDSYKENLEKAKMYSNEVRILRAYYHFELAKRYGDIPLITKTYTMEETDSIRKTSFNDVIEYIVEECDSVAPLLPISHKDFYSETGRITRGTAMAIKARALLYAASPLHNPRNNKELWKAAAAAAHDIIKNSVEYKYSPLPLIADDFLYDVEGGAEVLKSTQLIFERRQNASNSFERRNLPFGFEEVSAGGGNTPTQNLVDAFEINIGGTYVKFDWLNSTHKENMYYDVTTGNPTRDPRLYLNVICNTMRYMGEDVETNVGGKNGLPTVGATLTGYYLKKLMNERVSLSPTNNVTKNHHFPTFRYVEVLLNYAEAMTQWKNGDATYTDATFGLSATDALNQIRTAAGMPAITETGTAFNIKLRNERRIELAFEDHRFWDIRRWKIGNVVEKIYGVKIESAAGGTFTYQRIPVQNRLWDDRMYLYPIPESELFKNPNLLPQNPGW